jgi:ABC-type bacteriocin/lantibiotic exporter with double-glycine peptidase domain
MAVISSKSPIERLFEIIKLERNDIYFLALLTFGYGLLGIATPVAVQSLVNIVTMGGVLQPLYVVSFILFVLLALSGILYVLEGYVVELIQRRLFIRNALEVGKNAQGVKIQMYDNHNPVELMNRFFDIVNLQKSAAVLLTVGLTALLQGLIGSFILMFYSIYFVIIIILMLVFLFVIIWLLGERGLPTAIEESQAKYKMVDWLETIARNVYLFKFFHTAQRTHDQTDALATEHLIKRFVHYKILLLQNIGAVTLYAVIGTAMLMLGGALVIQGQINLGQFVAAELIIFGVLAAFVRLIKQLQYYYDMLTALDKLGILHDFPQESTGKSIPSDGQYHRLSLQDIGFAFAPHMPLIKNISIDLSRGRSLSVLGASGSGKSTLVALITGLRSPDKGHINLNGIDLRQLNLAHYRSKIGLANKIEIIDGSVLDNLKLGREIPLSLINQVLETLGLSNDFAKLEHGMDTVLTAFGAPLSTTQMQRLMLARAVIGQPDILIIDGLLDSLTSEELSSILALLKENQANWLLIVTTRIKHIAAQFDSTLNLNLDVG